MNYTTYPNEPAGPLQYEKEVGDFGRKDIEVFPGLTKREYFAAMAMPGYIAAGAGMPPQMIADHCVAVADCIIAALNSKQTTTTI